MTRWEYFNTHTQIVRKLHTLRIAGFREGHAAVWQSGQQHTTVIS